MTRYCPPIRDRWRPENGVRLVVDFGDAGAALFHSCCRKHGIPCESKFVEHLPEHLPEPVPIAVADLVERAVGLAAYPDRNAPLWAEAKRLLAEAEARMLAADVASAEQQFTPKEAA